MRTFRLLLFACLALACMPALRAQTDAELSQYWAIPTYYNPAAAGSTDYLRIRAAGRVQWIGIDNAPMTFLGQGDMALKAGNQKVGVGVGIGQESIGLFSNFTLNLQLGYRFRALGGEFSLGVQGGLFNQAFKGSKVEIPDGDDYHQTNDDAIPTQDLTGNAFDLGVGVWYQHPKFYAGLSALHAMNTTVTMSVEGNESGDAQRYETELVRTIYFMAGGNIKLPNTLIELQPSLLVRSDLTTYGGVATLQGVYNQFIRLGVGYRWKDAVSVLLGVDYKDFFFGYSYDYPLNAISKASSGSHELVVGYRTKLDFSGKNKNRHRSIRLM